MHNAPGKKIQHGLNDSIFNMYLLKCIYKSLWPLEVFCHMGGIDI